MIAETENRIGKEIDFFLVKDLTNLHPTGFALIPRVWEPFPSCRLLVRTYSLSHQPTGLALILANNLQDSP